MGNPPARRRRADPDTSAGPHADAYDAPDWKAFVADYQKNYPVSSGAYPTPSLFALVYYINMKAALDGLDAVKG